MTNLIGIQFSDEEIKTLKSALSIAENAYDKIPDSEKVRHLYASLNALRNELDNGGVITTYSRNEE